MKMDPYTTMESLGECAKATTKFGQIIEKIFGPYWTRKQAEADAYADQKKLQIIRDNSDLNISYFDGKLNASQYTQDELLLRAQQRTQIEALRQEENIEKILENAAKELQVVENVSDNDVDDDWITRFFNIVKDISNEQMQYIWGKILANEIISPKSFSLKTLDVLRNISTEDAEKFQKIFPLIMHYGENYFISSENDILLKYGTSFSDILYLDACELMNSSGTLSLNFQVAQNKSEFILNDEVVIKISGYKNESVHVKISIHTLTKAGKEMYIALSNSSNNEYVCEFAQNIFKENKKNVKTSVHELSFQKEIANKDEIIYSQKPIVSYEKDSTNQ